MSRLYTVREVATMFNVSEDTIREMIRKKQIEATKGKKYGVNGRLWLISDKGIRDYKRKLLDKYIDEKLDILDQLQIKLTWRQLEHLRSCKTEFEVDAFYHDLITGKSRIK